MTQHATGMSSPSITPLNIPTSPTFTSTPFLSPSHSPSLSPLSSPLPSMSLPPTHAYTTYTDTRRTMHAKRLHKMYVDYMGRMGYMQSAAMLTEQTQVRMRDRWCCDAGYLVCAASVCFPSRLFCFFADMAVSLASCHASLAHTHPSHVMSSSTISSISTHSHQHVVCWMDCATRMSHVGWRGVERIGVDSSRSM